MPHKRCDKDYTQAKNNKSFLRNMYKSRSFSVKQRDVATYISIDYKAIIPVGEPGHPGVRGYN